VQVVLEADAFTGEPSVEIDPAELVEVERPAENEDSDTVSALEPLVAPGLGRVKKTKGGAEPVEVEILEEPVSEGSSGVVDGEETTG